MLVAIQVFEAPIAIETLTVDSNATIWGISGDSLADEIKSEITEINSESGELYRGRKLGAATVPLDVKIGDWDITVEKLTKAFNVRLTSAHVTGHLSKVDQCIVLETATSMGDDVRVDVFQMDAPQEKGSPGVKKKPCTDLPPIAGGGSDTVKSVKPPSTPESSMLESVDSRIQCAALRVVVAVSPDVAANYLFKRAEGGENHPPDPNIHQRCKTLDDVNLYSQVAEDGDRDATQRANALIGLSLVYLRKNQVYEAINLAEAATQLLEKAKNCAAWKPGFYWAHLKCRASTQLGSFKRVEVAAWMQLGQATASYAPMAGDDHAQDAVRSDAIHAFKQATVILPDYALAYDAIGLQEAARGNIRAARDNFHTSLDTSETPAAHYDLGKLYVSGRNEFVGENYWSEAEKHFRAAIRLQPNYWDAHRELGYVLFETERYRQAIDVLKPAEDHEASDGDLYRHLGSAYAGICQFDKARQEFKIAYSVYAASRKSLSGLSTVADEGRWKEAGDNLNNTLTDWGKVLNHFGLRTAAINQEQQVTRVAKDHVYALESLGQFQIKAKDKRIQAAGIENLKHAFAADAKKQDFVLADYLNGLTETGHVDQAIQLYEQ